ncbi:MULTISPECIES: type II 3-dehydroquinate dehydratase [unclassified Ekhidna]|jgi:3-dehydroquinate dehydratase-2|uniref:type II 3-dehydroquinate dehydratase n=1 Tax=unclassified Ekhidna TaxID=2632188 RepID=UPI0032DE7E9D
MRILILNGPNLNLLGKREPEIYGNQSFDDFFEELKQRFPDHNLEYFQSNHEGALIDKLHEVGFSYDGVVFNPGAYTHTSIALRDAISGIETPVFEVHISNLAEREDFRQISYIKDVCIGSINGMGFEGYEVAIEELQSIPPLKGGA